MKNKKTLKRVFSAVVASALMTSAVSAQVVYEQDFENVTQYDLFGNVFNYTGKDESVIKNLFPGETITDEDGKETVNSAVYTKKDPTFDFKTHTDDYSASFFSIENEKGVMTVTGKKQNDARYRYGFKKNLSEEIAALNATGEETTETSTTDNVIKSGVWNFDFTLQSMQGGSRFFVLRKGDTEKMILNIAQFFEGISLVGSKAEILNSNTNKFDPIYINNTKYKLNDGYYTDTPVPFSYCTINKNGDAATVRVQVDFDNQKVNLFKITSSGTWGQITRIPTEVDGLKIVKNKDRKIVTSDSGTIMVLDENGGQKDSGKKNATAYDDSGIPLSEFDVDLSDGIDTFGYEEVYVNAFNRTIVDDIKISNASDDSELFSCNFNNTNLDENGKIKDSWVDYGFKTFGTGYLAMWLNDGKLSYSPDYLVDMIFDKEIGETANSGVWAVSIKYFGENKDGTGSSPATYNGTDQRSFINFLNDEHNNYDRDGNNRKVALGLSFANSTYSHMWKVTGVNGEKVNDTLNENAKNPNSKNPMVTTPLTGVETKVVIDFNTTKTNETGETVKAPKMYMYVKVDWNRGNWTLMNPEGYELPADFNFNKIRLYDCNNGNKGYGAWDYIKIEKFDNTDNVVFTVDSDQGNMVDKDTILNINIESYRAPSAESKTTFIDKSEVYTIAAVYDGNKLVDLKPIPNVQYSVAEEFNTELQFDKIDNGNKIKIFAVDPTSLKPLLSGEQIKTFEGVNMSDAQ